MSLLVQKFGGTSVGSLERIQRVARRSLSAQREGHQVVVVTSAMSGETNRLLALAQALSPLPDGREMDTLAATGEQCAAALVALAIQAEGGAARSLLGHQVRVCTDGYFTKARIQSIEQEALRSCLARGEIPVVAGFQGVNTAGEITTLGRGGSDTSAVAIAAALGATCEIYTDVEGVYTTDPGVCATARKIDQLAYEEMLELASLGAKVLHLRSVEIAMKYQVPLHVRSSFSEAQGTWVVGEEKIVEQAVVSGVAYDRGEVRVDLLGIPTRPEIPAQIFGHIADHNLSVDMILYTLATQEGGSTGVTFTLSSTDLPRAKQVLEEIARTVGAQAIHYDTEVSKISVVGLAMRSHAGVAAKIFRLLAQEGIPVQAVSTSEIRVSCLIPAKYTELAVRVLHDGFGLGRDSTS